MKSDKYRKEFIEFDQQVCKEIIQNAIQVPEKFYKDESRDYKWGLTYGYLLGAGDMKNGVFKWLDHLDLVDVSNYEDKFPSSDPVFDYLKHDFKKIMSDKMKTKKEND